MKAPASSRALPSNPSPYQDAKLHLGRLFGAVIDFVQVYIINDIGAGGEQGARYRGLGLASQGPHYCGDFVAQHSVIWRCDPVNDAII